MRVTRFSETRISLGSIW